MTYIRLIDQNSKQYLKSSKRWDITKVLKNKIYIVLDPTFLNYLRYRLKEKNISQKKLARIVNVKRPTVSSWFSSKYKLPYNVILILSKTLSISKKTVIRNIDGIALNKGKIIYKPKINIKFDKYLARFLGHICGDGCINHKHIVCYTNKEITLIDDFINLTKSIFGSVDYLIYEAKDKTLNVILPKLIGEFLIKCFNNIEKKEVPLDYLIHDRDKIIEFIGAIFDDEGHASVEKKTLVIQLAQLAVLEDLKLLLKRLNIESSPIGRSRNNKYNSYMYRLNIYRRKNIKKFYNNINLKHEYKKESIEKLIGSYSKKYADFELKEAILKKLQNKSMISSELSNELNTSLSSICKCLSKLRKEKFVFKEKVHRNGYQKEKYMVNLWRLK